MDENLKKFEQAARIYLESSGQDPDQEMRVPHPTLVGQYKKFPIWHVAAEELIDFSRKLTALKKAAELQKPKLLQS